MFSRPIYERKLIDSQNKYVVKVLTGVRRCGKSTLLKLFRKHLVLQGVPENSIIEIDFELPAFADLQNSYSFYQYMKARIPEAGPTYLFVDEVQELEEWAKTINGVRAEFDADIYVTGSNSRMFAGEHLTFLSGRYIPIEVYPLSFLEYCSFKRIDVSQPTVLDDHYDDYLKMGSFPAVSLAQNAEFAQSLLNGLYDSIYSRDILLRGKIRNESAFLRVAHYAFDNIGNQTSPNSIANSLKNAGHAISSDTVDNYLTLMRNAFLLYSCPRYDIRGKELLRTNGKHYVVDTGLRNRVLGFRSSNHGHITENMVFLELKRRGYEVSVGTLPESELDFVAQSQDGRVYIQVCETVLDPNVYKRELTPFSKLKDGYPRTLITKDRLDYSTEGIRHINLFDFLLGVQL